MFGATNICSPLRPHNFKKSHLDKSFHKEMCMETYKWFYNAFYLHKHLVTEQFSRITSYKPHLSNPIGPEKGSKAAT
jgi:hypothetical protein